MDMIKIYIAEFSKNFKKTKKGIKCSLLDVILHPYRLYIWVGLEGTLL